MLLPTRRTRPLDLLPCHGCAELATSAEEERVDVGTELGRGTAPDALKAVDIQLPDEGLVLDGGEVAGQRHRRKFFGIKDQKASSVG
jgi:hypothetical protein